MFDNSLCIMVCLFNFTYSSVIGLHSVKLTVSILVTFREKDELQNLNKQDANWMQDIYLISIHIQTSRFISYHHSNTLQRNPQFSKLVPTNCLRRFYSSFMIRSIQIAVVTSLPDRLQSNLQPIYQCPGPLLKISIHCEVEDYPLD